MSDADRFLHVANGTCTTEVMKQAGIPGRLSIWADPLHDGPVPALADDELVELRAQYLAGEDTKPKILEEMIRWREVIADQVSYDELVLWYEHDLFDQLNLAQLIAWAYGQLRISRPVSLITVETFAREPGWKGLGQVAPRELAPLLESRQRIAERQVALAERAWAAFCEATPESLDALRHRDTSALPFMAAALERLLQEYPWTADGLSRSERRLLELADAKGIGLAAALPRMHEREDAYFITDRSLATIAAALSSGPSPLLVYSMHQPDDRLSLDDFVMLTAQGRAVLHGEADRVEVCGIDRWLGGVHLTDAADDWRWDDAAARTVRR